VGFVVPFSRDEQIMILSIDSEFDHEKLLCVKDHQSGLLAVIAFHSTVLGPAVGGMRFRRYDSLSGAMVDALRLGRAMTLKNAAARLDWGGGKLCVVDDGDTDRRAERLVKLAAVINGLDGQYIVGKDVGATLSDMELLSTLSPWVVGIPESRGGLGDPSPATARTVVGAMKAASQVTWGNPDLSGASASIIGVGGVGASLARKLAERGVSLFISDIDEARTTDLAAEIGAEVLSLPEALTADVDFLAPCATGEMINDENAPTLRCRIVAGGANNPLTHDSVATELHRRGILYVPDFLSNAGGVIQNAAEFRTQGWAGVDQMIDEADARLLDLLERAQQTGEPPLELARAEALALVNKE
jgi:glutamate dehydrogenase/leucine dehydrogenase